MNIKNGAIDALSHSPTRYE